MIGIAIEYSFLFFKRKAQGKAPTAWGDLTERQFMAISRIIHGSEPDFRFLSVLTGISQSLLKKLSPYELLKLSEGIEFISKAGNFYHSFIIKEIQGTDFVCPKPKLEAMTFGQFIFADAYYNDWIAAKNEKALNSFVATIYMLRSENFDNATIADRLWTIANIDFDVRKAIAYNYGLIVMWLQKCYPLIFQDVSEDPDCENRDKDENKSARKSQSGWIKLFDSMVGDDLINREKYAELSVHTVLRHLTNKYKENARRK